MPLPVKRALLAAAAALSVLALSSRAEAGGFFLTDRGTRPLGRGGAFIAGADDPSALWYNPAGLGFSGRQLMIDATWNVLAADFTRIDGGGMTQPTVSASVAPIPIPGVAYTEDFGLRQWTFGLGVFAPNALLLSWPETVDLGGVTRPAPQRYSLISMNGSLVASIVAGAAWRPIPQLSIGVTFDLLVASFRARTTLSACDRAICTQPENPEYDALSEVDLQNAISPTGSLGVIWDPGPVRLGLSAHLPYAIAGDAAIRVRIPSAPAFDGATVTGDRARVGLDFPWSLKAGVELRAVENLRAELALVWETWSQQRSLVIDPHDVYLENVLAVGRYQVGTITIPRNMIDTLSIRLGAEYHVAPVDLRAGISYENGSFNDATLTPLTLDSDKVAVSLGASVEVSRGIFLDAIVAHVFLRSRSVRNSMVPQSDPIRPAVTTPVMVGDGDYTMDDWVLGVGFRWQVDAASRPAAHAPPGAATPDTEHGATPDTEHGTTPASAPRHPAWPPPRDDAQGTHDTPRAPQPPPHDTTQAPTTTTTPGRHPPGADDAGPANPYRPPPPVVVPTDDAPSANPYRPGGRRRRPHR